jgi:predicted Fe-Mo cluster-binding NifX family protein
MNKKTIRFAFAVNQDGCFQQKHFGDADKFLIYEWANGKLVLVNEMINSFQNFDEEQLHGSPEKGKAVSGLLKKQGVKVLVSRRFGKNIQIVNRHFIPVIVSVNNPKDAVPVLTKHIKWIEDELSAIPHDYKLFTIKEGVLKTRIKKDK